MVGMVRGGDKRWDVLDMVFSETVQIHILVPLLIAISNKVNDLFEFQYVAEVIETPVFLRLLKKLPEMDNWHTVLCTVPDTGQAVRMSCLVVMR